MAKIRVLRVLEYTYDSVEAYEADRMLWTEKSPPGRTDMKMRSAELPLEAVDDDPWWECDCSDEQRKYEHCPNCDLHVGPKGRVKRCPNCREELS